MFHNASRTSRGGGAIRTGREPTADVMPQKRGRHDEELEARLGAEDLDEPVHNALPSAATSNVDSIVAVCENRKCAPP